MKLKRVLGIAAPLMMFGKSAFAATTGIAAVDAFANGAINVTTHGIGGLYTIKGLIKFVHGWHDGEHGDLLRGGGSAAMGFATYGATTISTAFGGPAGTMIHATTAHLPWAMRLASHLLA